MDDADDLGAAAIAVYDRASNGVSPEVAFGRFLIDHADTAAAWYGIIRKRSARQRQQAHRLEVTR